MRAHHERYQFCPSCGGTYPANSYDCDCGCFRCPTCGHDFYQNSKPSCTALVPDPARPDHFLLLTRSTPPEIGKLALPGGFLNHGESPEAGVLREVLEETGLHVSCPQLIGARVFDYEYEESWLSVIELNYLVDPGSARLSGGSTREASHLAYYKPEDILRDPSRLAFPAHADVLREHQTRKGSLPVPR